MARGRESNSCVSPRFAQYLIHPPTQEATAVKLWRNAQRVSFEALAKGDMLPAFVAEATSAE
jgi:hypothetical protein